MSKEMVHELTPALADKIFKDIQKKRYDETVSKASVIHHLKQLKAQMGKEKRNETTNDTSYRLGIEKCMEMIDKKIAKISK